MHSLLPAPHIPAFTSFAKATSKARKAALFLSSVALLLAGGTAAVRGQSALRNIARLDATTGEAGDGFNPDANNGVRAIVVQGLNRETLHLCWDTALRDLQIQLEPRVSRIEVALGSASVGWLLVPRALGTVTGNQQQKSILYEKTVRFTSK